MSSGSAARRAATASVWLPEAIASSTLRTKVRMRLRRDLLIAVRFAILRVIFLADTVLAMAHPRSLKSRWPSSSPWESSGSDRLIAWKPKSPRDARAHVRRLIDVMPANVNDHGPLRVKKAPKGPGARDWPGRAGASGPSGSTPRPGGGG